MKNNKYSFFDRFLIGFSFSLIGIGVVVFFVFIYKLKSFYSISGTGRILLTETAQVGDFIGGIIGSIWALASVLLFYLAIRLQSKELRYQLTEITNQNLTLEDQRKEFEINRITQIIYSQITRIDNSIMEFQIPNSNDLSVDSKFYRSYSAINIWIGKLKFKVSENPELNRSTLLDRIEKLSENYDQLIQLLEIVVSSTVAIDRCLQNSKTIDEFNKCQLFDLYSNNLSPKIDVIINQLHYILDQYFTLENPNISQTILTNFKYMHSLANTYKLTESNAC